MIITLPKLGPVRFDDNLSPEEFQQQVETLSKKYDFKIPKPDVGIGTLLGRGFMRGMGETGIALGDILPAMGASALGFEDYAKKQMGEAAASRAELERKYPTQFKSYEEISSPYEALQYGAETLGELGPTALTAMIPGIGAEAVGARLAGQSALRAAQAAGPVSRAGLAAVEKTAETAGRRAMYGGVYLGSFAQNAPEVFESIYKETNKMEPGIAALAGGISSLLDSVVPGQVMDNLGKYGKMKVVEQLVKDSGAAPKVWKYIGKEAVKTAGAEGLTETAQEAINAAAEQVAGSTKGLLDPENIQRFKESFVKGAIGGGAFGTVGGTSQGLTARKEYRNTKEAEEALQAQYEAEKAAGTLTPEKAAEYEAQIEAARKQREAELTQTFAGLPDFNQRQVELQALQARMDQARPGSPAYAELEEKIKAAQEEVAAEQAKQAEIDAKKAEGSAFAKVPPTPGTGGMYKPGLEQQRAEQQAATRQFAFGPVATNVPGDPVTVDTLKNLKVSDRSKVGMELLGTDLDTADGRRKFIQTLENPSFMGNIDPAAYDDIISTFDPKEVAAARAEMKAETLSPTKQKQQEQTRTFAFGAPNVTRPNAPSAGGSAGMAGKSDTGGTTTTTEGTEPGGMVSTGTTTEQPTDGEGQQSTTVNEGIATDGTTTTKTQQTETQGQEAPTAGTPTVTVSDQDIVHAKLGQRGVKLDEQGKDAKAYFGKVTVPLALDSIANDLVYQPTAYRNAKMKAFENHPNGPQPAFSNEAEAAFFLGQGGVHAKNAAAWVRANMSPESVAFMEQKVAQYEKEKRRSESVRRRQEAQTKVRKATKQQVADETATAEAEGEYVPTKDDIKEFYGTKSKAGKEKGRLQRLANELAQEDLYGDLDNIADSDLGNLLADEELAALHSQAHPVVLNQLANNNLVGALNALAESGSSKGAELFARLLAKVVGDVNVVYGAEKSMYDPKTNTVYLRDGASEYEIIHEASHAAMSHVLDNPSHPVTRQLTTLFNQLKSSTEGTYGAQNLQEFAAEAWSNDAFRSHLKQFKPTGEKLTGWERLVNAVRQLFRLPPKHETALTAIDRMLNEIVSPPPETRTGETLYAQSLHNPNVVQEMFTKMNKTIRKQPVMNTERAVGFWKAAEKVGATGRTLMYKSLNLFALGDVAKKYLGDSAVRFANTIEEMAGYQEKLREAMIPLHNRLEAFRQSDRYQAWSTLVNDTTREDVNPDAPLSKYQGSPEKVAQWKQFNARFNKLTDSEKKLYRDLFATYKALDDEFLKSLERNVEATVGDKAKAASAYQKILFELSTLRIDHYAPLFREGPFWLQYDINGDVEKQTFASEAERDFARKQLEAKGATNFDAYSRADQLTTKTVPSGSMLADIMKIMKDNGAGEDAINDLIQLVVKSMPEASILKSRQKRTGIGGYIDNAAYVFDRVSSGTARQLARMQYGPELQRLVKEMEETVNKARGDANTYGVELLKEFEGRRQFAMKPTLSNLSQFASSGAFYYNLAGNVSSALVNLLQTPMIVFPQLGGEYGFKAAGDALNNARKLYTGSGFSRKVTELTGEASDQRAMTSIENLVNAGKAERYRALIEAMKSQGMLTTSTARDALYSENDNKSLYGSTGKLQRITTLVGSFMFHHAERMNREITAVAAFDLEMQKLKNSKMSDAEKQTQAINKAMKMVEYSHGAGSTLSGPSLGQSDLGKVLMVFKRYAFSMYYMLFDTMMRSLPVKGATGEQLEQIKAARKQLAGIYGMAALFAGAKGVPLYWVAELAYNMFQGDDDDDFDTVMRGFLGDFAYKGPVNYLTNLSVADRVGWTDLLWREQKGSKADASALSQFVEGVLGAPYSIADSILRGKDLMAEGQFERGIEAMLPVSLRNIMKSIRYANEGANTLRGDAVGDVNGYNAAMQILGFAPADLMKQYEENAYMTGKAKAIRTQEKNALKKYYAAMREGDTDGMMDAQEKLFDLGTKYPELGITQDTLNKSVASRERISREMYHGVQLDRKLAPYLRQAAAGAYGE
jgi:hypothetical protein